MTVSLSKAVDYLAIVFPAFLFDGERNTTVVQDTANNRVCVELPGDALSGLGTTSVVYQLVAPPAPATLDWMVMEPNSTSRNGYMEAVEVRVYSLAEPTLTYTITPQGSACARARHQKHK